jgi:monofunctional biosynthetic peptidoglycan transglycosylase
MAVTKTHTVGIGLRIWRILKKVFLFLFIFHLLYILLLKWVDPPVTLTQLGSWVSGHGLTRDYVDWDEISPHMKIAVMASEDQKFLMHGGLDWVMIEKAMENNKQKKKRRVLGASTISQQVAKNVFLWQGRSWIRKGLEVYFTKMIEWIWGKRRILEVYLNVIETGKGVFGVEAASQEYFNKPASALRQREAAGIASFLPNPKIYSQKPNSGFINKRRAWIAGQMNYMQRQEEVRKLVFDEDVPEKKNK